MAIKDGPAPERAYVAAIDAENQRIDPASGIRRVADFYRPQYLFIGVALAYILLGYAAAKLYAHPFSVSLYSKFQLALYLVLAVAFLVYRVFRVIWKHRPDRPLGAVWRDLMGECRLPHRILAALPALALLPFALSASTSVKRLIPVIRPFDWDATFARLDAVVHGGYQPWELLQPIVGSPMVTKWIDYAYGPPWFWMMVCVQFWQTFTLQPRRVQFLVTFVLCWALIGNVLATIFSSVGPVYYGNFVDGPNPFAPLMAYLESVADSTRLLAWLSQQYLWETHVNHDLTVGVGISAMPSMHIAMGFLFALACWHTHWTLRFISACYLAVLLVGSVHLGWHYAIDGYVSIILTFVIWRLAGSALDRFDRRSRTMELAFEQRDRRGLEREW